MNKKVYFLDLIIKCFSFQSCICCGKKSGILQLCNQCIKSISEEYLIQINRCHNCGKILISENNLCMDCRDNPVIQSIDSLFPIFSYRLWKKEMLYNWKISGNRNYSFLFGELINKIITTNYLGIPIVPIPPRPKKIFFKGWDQINDLCNEISLTYHHKVLKVLERTELQQQKKLNRVERLSHKGNSYILKKNVSLPDEVILIDDIITTGVTIETCALLLKRSGVKKVHAISIFIVD